MFPSRPIGGLQPSPLGNYAGPTGGMPAPPTGTNYTPNLFMGQNPTAAAPPPNNSWLAGIARNGQGVDANPSFMNGQTTGGWHPPSQATSGPLAGFQGSGTPPPSSGPAPIPWATGSQGASQNNPNLQRQFAMARMMRQR